MSDPTADDRPVPILRTARLTLRGHGLADRAASAAMWADERVVRYIGGKPSSAQQSWMRLLGYVGHWRLLGFGYWAVEETATGAFAGELGFANFERDPSLALGGVPEIGWAFARRMHGRGYATEAVRAAVGWGDRARAWDRTACIVDPANVASIRLAERCGYVPVRRVTVAGSETIVFERARGSAANDPP